MSKKPRILFMGTPDFAVTILAGLVEAGYDVVQVMTQPDRPTGRGKKLAPPPVKIYAEAQGLPLWQETDLEDPHLSTRIQETGADLAIVAAYGRILPAPLLESLALGFVNIHASLLPAYRGPAPIQWAVRNGDAKSGVSLMQMDAGMDTGDILAQSSLQLGPDETTGSLFERMALLGRNLLLEKLPEIAEGSLIPQPQDEAAASYAPMFDPEDEAIDWTQSAEDVERNLRAYLPEPGNYSFLDGQRLKIFKVEMVPGQQAPAGQVIAVNKNSFVVQCGKDAIEVWELQPPGKRRMPTQAYLNGNKLDVGAQFGPKS